MTTEQLNALQNHGIISDLCVTWEDVPECDRRKAHDWLKRRDLPALRPERETSQNN